MRIDRVYTKGGDKGETSLIGGERVSKAGARIEAYGTVDELNAAVGLVRAALAGAAGKQRLDPTLARIQHELFNLGAELATPDAERRARQPAVEARHLEALEGDIDELNEGLPELRSFVLPGGGAVSAHCHHARTVCRRAERVAVALADREDVSGDAIRYLNRLSDAFFVFGRWAAAQTGEPELLWDPKST